MISRYILAPQAAQDLVDIWSYVKSQGTVAVADQVEAAIFDRIAFLSSNPGAGHWRKDLTTRPVKFFSVYSLFDRLSSRDQAIAGCYHSAWTTNVEGILGSRGLKQKPPAFG